jgi:hypothetical protein
MTDLGQSYKRVTVLQYYVTKERQEAPGQTWTGTTAQMGGTIA